MHKHFSGGIYFVLVRHYAFESIITHFDSVVTLFNESFNHGNYLIKNLEADGYL